jgi:hypothetical protein
MNLEIIITKKKEKYEAKCPAYPHCKGYGKTEPEALSHLSDSISRYVRKDTKKELDSLFNQKNYSEILNDSYRTNTQEHRVYDVEKSTPSFQKNLLLKLDKLPELRLMPTKKEKQPTANDFFEALKSESHQNNEIPLKESTISILETPLKTPEDGFIFGVPLSLN